LYKTRPKIAEGKKRILIETSEFINLNWGHILSSLTMDENIRDLSTKGTGADSLGMYK